MNKNKISLIILALILILSIIQSSYHVDYPIIGYHNQKEVHYLTEARNFAENGFFKHGFFIPERDVPQDLSVNLDGVHGDTFPTTSIIIGFLFMLFGVNIVIAKSFMILISLGTLIVFYFLIKKIFDDNNLALLSTFILSIFPLFVTWSKQIQLIQISLFFTLLGVLFFFHWKENMSIKNVCLMSLFLTLGIITKYTIILIVFPLIFLVPYQRLFKKVSHIVIGFFSLLIIPIWMLYNNHISKTLTNSNFNEQIISSFDPLIIFSKDFLLIFKSFLLDNYSLIGLSLIILGIISIFLLSNLKELNYFKFYIVGVIPWILVMGVKLKGHNYHQYPLLPLFAFAIAYLLYSTSLYIENKYNNKIKYLNLIFIGIFCIVLFFNTQEYKNNMFDTQYIGLDIAGEYMNANMLIEDRMFFSSRQSFGVIWHSNHKGYKTPLSVEEMIFGEENNANWIFIYSWGFYIVEYKELWQYIENNYEVKQVGFYNKQLLYVILKKGGSFEANNLRDLIQNKTVLTKEYEFTNEKRILEYVII